MRAQIKVWMHKKKANLVESVIGSWFGNLIFTEDIPDEEPIKNYPGAVIFDDMKEYRPEDYEDLGFL